MKGIINTLIYAALRVATLLGIAKNMYAEAGVIATFAGYGNIRPDGSYEPILLYEIYEQAIPAEHVGFNLAGTVIVSATEITASLEGQQDELVVRFSTDGWLNPSTRPTDRGRWFRLAVELFYALSEEVKAEDKTDGQKA